MINIIEALIYAIGTYHLLKYLVKFWLWFGNHIIKLSYDLSDVIYNEEKGDVNEM